MLFTPVSKRTLLKAACLSSISGPAFSLYGCASEAPLDLGTYLTVDSGKLVFVIPRSEMGQDIATTFAMLIAEELEAPLESIKIVFAGASSTIPHQMTVGSSSVRIWWITMRTIGACTKQLLLRQAANQSGEALENLYASNATVYNKDQSLEIPYVALLSEIAIPTEVPQAKLKSNDHFRLVGQPQRSIASREKVTGAFRYLDDHVFGLKTASIAYKSGWPRPDKQTLQSLKEQFGLEHVFVSDRSIGNFKYRVFLFGRKTWSLLKAKSVLEQAKREAIDQYSLNKDSNFDKKRAAPDSLDMNQQAGIRLQFETPPLPHIPMEPPCAGIELSSTSAEVWAPTQAPDIARKAVAKRLDLNEQAVTLHSVPMGGAFGRKRYTDFLEELAIAAQALQQQGMNEKLGLIWTREDELEREFYRPPTIQKVHIQEGKIDFRVFEGVRLKQDSPPTHITPFIPIGTEATASQEALKHHYSTGIWRSVQHGYHAFALCSAIDEFCCQHNINTLAYHLNNPVNESFKSRLKQLLRDDSATSTRLLNVIETVYQGSKWKSNMADNQGLGFATYSLFGTHIALVAQTRVSGNAQLKIERVWAAVDCGRVINPDKAKAQIEGAILYGLSACLYGDIPDNKDTKMLNFDTCKVIRLHEAPAIEVFLADNTFAPTGTGEIGVPVIAPAVCNAIRSLTGYRFTKLPILLNDKLNFANAVKVSDRPSG